MALFSLSVLLRIYSLTDFFHFGLIKRNLSIVSAVRLIGRVLQGQDRGKRSTEV